MILAFLLKVWYNIRYYLIAIKILQFINYNCKRIAIKVLYGNEVGVKNLFNSDISNNRCCFIRFLTTIMTDLIKSFNVVIYTTQFHQMTIIPSKISKYLTPPTFASPNFFKDYFGCTQLNALMINFL